MQLTMPGFELPKYVRHIERVKRKPAQRPAPLSHADTVRSVLERGRDLTASEIASHCHLTTTEVSRRTGELARVGSIHDTGLRRASPLGKPSIVWSAT